MTTNWRERPTIIHEINGTFDSILSLDENGTTDLKGVRKNIGEVLEKLDHPDRWFTITGTAIDCDNYQHFKECISNVKYKHWEDGFFDYKKGTRRVVLHSRDIRKRIGPFNPNLINYPELMSDISDMMENTPFEIFSASIDKAEHIRKYNNPWPVYTLCIKFILERYCRYLMGRKGILLLESRGKKEDAEILKYIIDMLENGNEYWRSEDFSCIQGVYFNPKWSDRHDKKMSFVSLELADLVSYPIHKYVKLNQKDMAFEVIEKKIFNYPYYNGYGLKVFP